MTSWDKFKDRLNEKSTWATLYATLMASLPTVVSLDFPYNLIFIAAAALGMFVRDGKVVQPVDPAL